MLKLLVTTALALGFLASATLRAEDAAQAGPEAHAMLTRLCDDFGGRLTGTEQNRAALEALATELRALGGAPEFDPFEFPGWRRGEESVEVLTPFPRALRAVALAYSPVTPSLTAEVVDLGDLATGAAPDDTIGRIGLLGSGTLLTAREIGRRAAELGLRAVLFINREAGGQLLARTGSFVGETLPVPVFSITQEDGGSLRRLLARGRSVRVRCATSSTPERVRTANLVLRFPGRSAERVIVGAHFDSWDLGQGALDNGLGVAQLYALARMLRGVPLARTVELVWFNGEEQGLWGSRHAAAGLGAAPVVAMLNLDMVGVPIAVNALGDEDLAAALERWHARRTPPLPQGVQNVNWFGSDHTPFQLAGVRALTFNAPLPRESVRYYHDRADTIDKLPEKIVTDSVRSIAEVLRALVDDATLTAVRRPAAATEKLFTAYGLERRMRAVGYWPFAATAP